MLIVFALTVHLHSHVDALKDAALAMAALIIATGKK
jgi:hypothetical protein